MTDKTFYLAAASREIVRYARRLGEGKADPNLPGYAPAWLLLRSERVEIAETIAAMGGTHVAIPRDVMQRRAKRNRADDRADDTRAIKKLAKRDAGKVEKAWVEWKARQLLGVDARAKIEVRHLGAEVVATHGPSMKRVRFVIPGWCQAVGDADRWYREEMRRRMASELAETEPLL